MRLVVNILILILLVTTLSGQEQVKTYTIKSGFIAYELTGNTRGTRKVWWDEYGAKTRTETNSKTVTKIFGMTDVQETNTVMVIIKDKYWNADLKDNSGDKGTVPMYEESHEFLADMTEKEQEEFAKELIESMGGEIVGNESIQGYSCEIMEVLGSKVWIHKGISLKTEVNIMGITANEMVSEFKPNTSVPASKFEPYEGVKYEEMSDAQQEMLKSFME